MCGINTRALRPEEYQALLPELAELRMKVFRDFPYLYDGTRAYEEWYLGEFLKTSDKIIVGAFDGDRLVGAATGAALLDEHAEFREPVVAAGYEAKHVFYCAESVLLPAYRGHGIGHRFFDLREAHARALGYRYCCFCAVTRPKDHPLRPANYLPLDGFWQKRGYRMLSGAQAHFRWKDLGDSEETLKTLQFWIREFMS